MLKEGLHVSLSLLRGYIHSGEECHIILQHGDLPCLFGTGLGRLKRDSEFLFMGS